MRYATLILLLLTSCCHFKTPHPKALSFGTYAVQCEPVRMVYCADTNEDSDLCQNVDQATRVLNRAIGHEVLHYAGRLTDPTLAVRLYKGGALVVYVAPVEMWPDPNVLGITLPKVAGECIFQVQIALSPIFDTPKGAAWLPQVLVHEMLHALGAEHASPESQFPSTMAPSVENATKILSEQDIQTIRFIYGA